MKSQEILAAPVYEQIANLLRAWIVDQDPDRPIRLPSEPELASRHGVARGTIRQALDVLTQEKLIQRTPGRGTHAVSATVSAWRRQRKPHAIAILTRSMLEVEQPATFYGQIYQGIALAAEGAAYRLTCKYQATARLPLEERVEVVDPEQVAGVIMIGIMDDRVIRTHLDAGYPVVCVDYHAPDPRADVLTVDCYGEGYQGTRFLLDLGHRHLFFLGNNIEKGPNERQEPDAELFETGCRRAVREAHLPDASLAIRYCRTKAAAIQEAAQWIGELEPRPTAGLVFSEDTIAELLPLLPKQGLSCPQSLSVLSRMSQPVAGVCGLRSDPLQMGRRAVTMLLERVTARREEPLRMAVPSVLCPGQTARRLST